MKTAEKSLVILMVASVLFLLSGCRHYGPEKMLERIKDDISSRLELTDSQDQHLESIRQEIMVKIKERRNDRKAMNESVIAQLESGNLEPAALKEITSKKLDQMEDTIGFVIDRISQFYSTLSDEQKAEFAAYFREKKEAWEKYHK